MDQSSQIPYSDMSSGQPGDQSAVHMDDKEENGETHLNIDPLTRVDDRTGRVHQTVDVAEVMRR